MEFVTNPCAGDEPQDLSRSTRRPNSRSELRRNLRTPDDELRGSLTGGPRPNQTPSSPRPNEPAGRQLLTRRRRSTSPLNHLPAEGPLFQPSLALNIDPVPGHPTHPHHTVPTSVTPTTPPPRLHLIKAKVHSCPSYSPIELLSASPPVPDFCTYLRAVDIL